MLPWTARTFQAVVVAAGVTAAGTTTASAVGTPAMPPPDLSQVPDRIGFTVPMRTCQTPPAVSAHGRHKVPCANVDLGVDSPNVGKRVGADIVKTFYGMAGELQDGQPPLAPGKPNRTLDHVFAETTRVEHMTKLRPNLALRVSPGYSGMLDRHKPEGGLLDTRIGPRPAQYDGFSAADTALEMTAAGGYYIEPLASPVENVMPVVENNPLQTHGFPLTLPKVGDVVPLTKRMPVLKDVDRGPVGAVRKATHGMASGAPQPPTANKLGDIPGLRDLVTSLNHARR